MHVLKPKCINLNVIKLIIMKTNTLINYTEQPNANSFTLGYLY